jgi:uncharacterized protein YjbI with pentapeptide repeats/Tol biopolymer transport system component
MLARRATHGRMEEKLMPDFDTRKPQGSNEPNRPRMTLIANRLSTLLSASKDRILSMAGTLRRSLMSNKLRSLLVGGVLLFVIAPALVGLFIYTFSGFGYPQQKAEYLNGKIVFADTSESGEGIWTMNADGSNMTPVKQSVEGDDLALSPDGEKIAFTVINKKVDHSTSASASASASASGPPTISVPHIFLRNIDGSKKVRLLDSPAGEPAWSPTGQQIAVSSDEKWSTEGVEGSGECDIYLVDVDGSGPPKRLPGKAGCETDPAWSPDGAEIAFSAGSGDIYVVNADGSGTPRKLTDDPGIDIQPSWSPSGSEIAFTHQALDGDTTDIYEINVEGSGTTRLTFSPLSEAQPTWSPDGEQIAFVRYVATAPGYDVGPMAIYKMDYDGTDPVLLKDLETAVAPYPDWWGTPQQDDGVEQATVDEHTEQAIKDWQALPTAELQTYKDKINHLLRQKKLRESKADSPARQLAQEWTSGLLRRLDKSRKEDLVRFLAEADIVQSLDLYQADLSGFNLSGVDLSGAHLNGATLDHTNLSGGNLSGSHLNFAGLNGANMNGANLSSSNLSNAVLYHAKLSHANLSHANLYGVELEGSVLNSANLSHANLKYSYLTGNINLGHADLSGPDLSDANLNGANLSGANLSSANLSGATMDHANLSGAIGVTEQSLERQILPEASYGLDGATMPDGSTHP